MYLGAAGTASRSHDTPNRLIMRHPKHRHDIRAGGKGQVGLVLACVHNLQVRQQRLRPNPPVFRSLCETDRAKPSQVLNTASLPTNFPIEHFAIQAGSQPIG